MQELEIKDVQSAAIYRVGTQGAVLGREGAKADIVVRNPSVSKRHAKIFPENGSWFLEDLGSSNGTFFANQRISSPVEIAPGSLFALAEIQFEVVRLLGGDATENEMSPPPSKDRGRAASIDDDMMRPAALATGDDGFAPRSSDGLGPSPVIEPSVAETSGNNGFPAFLAALPKAIAHYVVEIPKLIVNPLGTVRKQIEEQDLPPMKNFELAGWLLPPQIIGAAVGFVTGLAVQLRFGTLSIGTLIPIGPLVGAVIAAAIGGFLGHPICAWLIKFFKGRSDERSRTNAAISMAAASAIISVLGGVATLITLIPFSLIAVVGQVIGAIGSLLVIVIFSRWLVHFEVVKWLQIVAFPVLPILLVLGTAKGVFDTLTAPSPGAAMASAADAAKTVEEAMKAAEEAAKSGQAAVAGNAEAMEAAKKAMEAAGANSEEVAKAMKAAQEAAAAAAADPEAAKKLAEEAAKAAEAAGKAAAEQAAKAAEEAEEAAEKTEKAAEKPAEKAAAEKAEAAAMKEEAAAPPVTKPAPAPGGGYRGFFTKRAWVEETIAEDPTVLKKAGVQAAYSNYLKARYDVIKAWQKKSKGDPWKEKLNERLREIDLYEKTGKLIDDVYNKLKR